MFDNSNKEPPKPSIANLAPGTITNTPNQGEPQRKPSQKKTSILVPTNPNIQSTQNNSQSNPIIQPPQTTKLPENASTNPASNPSAQPKKPTTGGKLAQNSKISQRPPEDVDISIDFSLKYLLESMAVGRHLDRKDLQKIIKNFTMYIKDKKQIFSLDSIQQKIILKDHPQKKQVSFIKLSYLRGLQSKQKTLIGLFWTQVMLVVCAKLPFLSIQGCYEIIKLQIGLNKHLYCQKENQGTFDIKIFMDVHLFPILSGIITVDKNHKIFKDVQRQIENLSMGLFRGMKLIFNELYIMKNEQEDKYLKVFSDLQDQPKNKFEIVENLLTSFENMIVKIDEEHFENYISYFECIAESLCFYYQTESQLFEKNRCVDFIKFLDEHYVFFNTHGVTTSQSSRNFLEQVEKLVLGILFKHPFELSKWDKTISNLVFKSNLEMFQPFTYLLDYQKRQDYDHYGKYHPLRGIHWKQFIDSIIKLRNGKSESVDTESIEFIMNALETFLAQNADIFWSEPSNFQSFINFTIRYNDYASKSASNQDLRLVLLNMIRIATSLMGKSLEQLQQKQATIFDGDIEYPQNKKYSFAKNVHVEFSERFMKISQREFLECICDELRTIMIESTESQSQQEMEYNDVRVFKPEDIVKVYFLKLLISEPCLLFDLKKHLKDVKQQNIVNFLVIKTIKNPHASRELVELAFSALDTLIITAETSHLIEHILGLGQVQTAKSLPTLAQSLFFNPRNLTFVSRHCNILVNNNYQSQEWTRELLKIFYKKCQECIGESLLKNHEFVISYSQLLSNIVGRLNFGINSELLELKPFINIPFIIESIRYNLRFDYHKSRYINMIVEKRNKNKMQALLHAIRAYNTVLLYCLKNKNSKTAQSEVYTKSLVKGQKSISLNNQLISAFEARQLGIGDKEFHLQVKSGNKKEDTTSYANSLSFILISSTKQQRKTLKSINSDYENLIFETIQNLVKLNSTQNLTQLFSISQGTASLLDSNKSLGIRGTQKSLINEFVLYIEQSLNSVGIEILIFGKLIQEPERLRKIIDKVRERLQNSAIRIRIKPQLQMKLTSTLSRYFRESMVQMSLHKKESFTSIQIQDHFEYLIQCIVDFIGPFRNTRKPHEATIVDDILSNLYGGFLTVQTFSMDQFAKWLKNYHALLLNEINLKHLRNLSDRQFSEEPQPIYTLGEEYFNLLSLFLNCDQYFDDKTFKIISNIKNLPQILSDFILNIAVYTKLQALPQALCQILLQILTMSVRFYSLIQKKEQQKGLFVEVLDSVKSQQLKPSTNLILLQIELFNELKARYSSDEIDFNNLSLWPLQMNCIDVSFSTPSVRKMIQSLKKSTLNSTSFVSICNGLLFLIKNSQTLQDSKSILANDLFAVYKYFVNQPELSNLQKSSNFVTISSTYPKSSPSKSEQYSLSYKKVWILQLLLAILSTAQNNRSIENVRFNFQKVFLGDESVLKRFGLLMRKLSFTQAEIYMTWLSHLDLSIQQAIPQGQNITFAQKLELNQLLKMFNFILATQSWTSQFADGLTELVQAFISYRKIFESLASSSKKPKPNSLQQSILEGISLIEFVASDQMMRSGISQMQKQRVNDNVLKSTNSLELMHEILNIELSSQYAMICLTIAQTQHLSMFKKNQLLSDTSKWNIVLIDLTNAILKRYVELRGSDKKDRLLKTILQGFRESVYLPSDQNIQLSTQMLFTNSESLSCSLNGSIELLTQLLVETLDFLLERIQVICKKMKKEQHVEYKARDDEMGKIVAELKKTDKQDPTWLRFDPSDQRAMMTQTIRTILTRTVTVKNSHMVPNGR